MATRRSFQLVLRLWGVALALAGVISLLERTLSPIPAAGASTTLSFQPLADTFVSSAEPDRNFGTLTQVRADGSPDVRAFLRFDPDGVGGVVSEATLRVFANSANTDSIDVRGVSTSTWSETALTYRNMPAVQAVVDSSGPITSNTWLEWNVTSIVRGNEPISVALTTTSVTATSLASREATNRPQLVITFQPSASPSPSPSPSRSPIPSPTPSPSPSSPAPSTGVVIAAAGDIACDPGSSSFNGGAGTSSSCRQRYTANLLEGVAAVLPLGDIQYENATLTKFQQSYALSWGRFKTITRPAPGNHEYLTSGAAGYFDYFGAVAGSRSRGYYSFDLGGWHLVALNSNCSAAGGCAGGSPQYEWLKADLAANTAPCTLAYWHHPRFSHGNYASNATYQPFWQLLYNDGAEIVLAGHDHNYQRFAPQTPSGTRDTTRGIRQFVVGSGGKSHYAVGSGPNLERSNGDTYGVLKLRLRSTSYEWTFVPEAGKTFTDSGTGSCH
jgi:hypothetical protein